MVSDFKKAIGHQFGGAIDMLANAIRACPDEVWGDRAQSHEFWYLTFHTLFWLDLYLHGSVEGYAPPEPFTLDELSPAGVLPDRVYTRAEMMEFLEHCRSHCRAAIDSLSDERARIRCRFGWGEVTFAELLLYNMRHVQHHAAQLNLILRQRIGSAPGWVARAV